MKMNRTIIVVNNSFNIHILWKIRSKLQFIILKDLFFSFQEYSVQITFRQQWNDNRLAFNNMDGEYYISRSPQHECTKLRFDKILFNDNLTSVSKKPAAFCPGFFETNVSNSPYNSYHTIKVCWEAVQEIYLA